MAERAIREYDAKRLLASYMPEFNIPKKLVLVGPETNLKEILQKNDWLAKEKLVVKVDQLIGKRAERNLLKVDVNADEALSFISENMLKEIEIGNVKGNLTHFLIEPFYPHKDEYYAAIIQESEGDRIYFSEAGGKDIEERWKQVDSLLVPVGKADLSKLSSLNKLSSKPEIVSFLKALYNFYCEMQFTYLELNPFAIENGVLPLDVKAKLDDCAAWECGGKWQLEFPQAFGRKRRESEECVREIDSRTGASLKFNLLNKKGRLWLLIAGGGASMIYADTICDLGFSHELANYSEYSGNPSEEDMYKYTKAMISEMDDSEKALLIGGGIANFTQVDKTFSGIIRALKEEKEKLKKCKIYVRRGGPKYEVGLEMMKNLEKEGLQVKVFGPEEHMTSIVSLALKELGLKK